MSFAPDFATADDARPGTQTPRGPFVPPWYQPHTREQLELQVIGGDGQPLGFTIRQVAPERRWAIDADGRVAERHAFLERLQQWYEGQWTWRNPPVPPLDVSLGGFPNPETFVSKGVDPSNPRRLVTLTPGVHRRRDGTIIEAGPVVSETITAPGSGWKQAPKRDNPTQTPQK